MKDVVKNIASGPNLRESHQVDIKGTINRYDSNILG